MCYTVALRRSPLSVARSCPIEHLSLLSLIYTGLFNYQDGLKAQVADAKLQKKNPNRKVGIKAATKKGKRKMRSYRHLGYK